MFVLEGVVEVDVRQGPLACLGMVGRQPFSLVGNNLIKCFYCTI
jgi:hypothetical protein